MESVGLDNQTERYCGDSVGVATRFVPAGHLEKYPMELIQSIWAEINGLPDDQRRSHPNTKEKWLGTWLAQRLAIDLDNEAGRNEVKSIIREWDRSGIIQIADGERNENGNYPKVYEYRPKE